MQSVLLRLVQMQFSPSFPDAIQNNPKKMQPIWRKLTNSDRIKPVKKIDLILSLILLITFAGCATTPQSREILAARGALPPSYEIRGVPFVEQLEKQCGPAALAMVAQYSGLSVSLTELSGMMFTPAKQGTFQADFLSSSRRLGLLVVEVNRLRSLLTEVSNGHPVVVLQNLGSTANPVWHYAVVFGYDLNREMLYLHSGTEARQEMDLPQFERTWKKAEDWSLVITRPPELPSTPSDPEILQAVSSLEKVKQLENAKLAYQALAKRSQDFSGAYFGWGFTAASLGRWHEAETAFERAAKLLPRSLAVWNNLAEVYEHLRKPQLAADALKTIEKLSAPKPK